MATAGLNRAEVRGIGAEASGNEGPHSKSVMRQTQALIGLVVLGGAGAAYFVDMAWVVVPAFAGMGLLFAGASGICPMASLIARMPWNQGADGACCGGAGCVGTERRGT